MGWLGLKAGCNHKVNLFWGGVYLGRATFKEGEKEGEEGGEEKLSVIHTLELI